MAKPIFFDPAQPICPADREGVQYLWVEFWDECPECWQAYQKKPLQWGRIPQPLRETLTQGLTEALRAGQVYALILSFDPEGEDYFLTADFEYGWAALLYNALDQYTLAPYRPEAEPGAEPVKVGGHGAIPQAFLLKEDGDAAEIIDLLLRQGRLWPGVQWAVGPDPDLPWQGC